MSLEESVQVGPAHYTTAAWEKNTPKTIVHFYTKQKRMELKSQVAGEDVYEPRTFIKKITPGDTTLFYDQPATQRDIEEYPNEYEAFQHKKTIVQSGVPLEQWSQLSPEQVAPLKALNIYTVEHLASLPDSAGSKIFGFVKLRERAQLFLKERSKIDVVGEMRAQLADRDATIAQQGRQIAELAEAVKKLSERKKPGRPKKVKPEAIA